MTYSFGNFVEPYARQTGRVLVAEARADFLSLVIQEGTFRQVEKNVFMQVAEAQRRRHLGGLFIADSRDPALDMIYYAREGSVLKRDGTNLAVDGERRNPPAHSQGRPGCRSSDFTSYAFDLSEFSQLRSARQLSCRKIRRRNISMAPDPNDKIFQKAAAAVDAPNCIGRLSEWLYPLAFAMIAHWRLRPWRAPTANQRRSAMFNAVAAAFRLALDRDICRRCSRKALPAGAAGLSGSVARHFCSALMACLSSNIAIEWPGRSSAIGCKPSAAYQAAFDCTAHPDFRVSAGRSLRPRHDRLDAWALFFPRYLVTVGYLLLGIMALVFVTTFTQVNDRLLRLAGLHCLRSGSRSQPSKRR